MHDHEFQATKQKVETRHFGALVLESTTFSMLCPSLQLGKSDVLCSCVSHLQNQIQLVQTTLLNKLNSPCPFHPASIKGAQVQGLRDMH